MIGRVRLPSRNISAHAKAEPAAVLAFNQWQVTAEHRPLGRIMPV
jgi:hypothetical protein